MLIHKQRSEGRVNISLEARMRVGPDLCSVTLVNASSGGVLAMLPNPPVRGARVTLVIGGRELRGQVRWRGADRCGIALAERIDVSSLHYGRIVSAGNRPCHSQDTYRGPHGILRTITNDVPLASRTFNMALLVVAMALTIFVLSSVKAPVVQIAKGVPQAPFALFD